MKVVKNMEKNGIEIYFDEKPLPDILTGLKKNGFRWNKTGGYWYAKETQDREQFAAQLQDGKKISAVINQIDNNRLFELTRTESIEDNYGKTKLHDTKEIAAIIRKHVRQRFPMCKWSVRSSYNSICLNLVSSPFAKDSEVLKAITHYVYKFAQSWNYDNSDSMTDYFDVNFYGVYENSIVSYGYVQREATVHELNMESQFNADLAVFREQEELRQQKEWETAQKLYELSLIEAEKQMGKTAAEVAKIEENAKVKDVDYYLVACQDPGISKCCCISEYQEHLNDANVRITCQVTREVVLSDDVYELFCNNLLEDFTFLKDMGGSQTLDNRVQCGMDYSRMSSDERKTVEWYSVNCIVVSSMSGERIVIDPQGYSYARYVFFIGDYTKKIDSYNANQIIEDGEDRKYRAAADDICNVLKTYKLDGDDAYMAAADKIHLLSLPINIEIVRACRDISMKDPLYKLLDIIKSNRYQFSRSGLHPGDEITILRTDEWTGMFTEVHATYSGYSIKKYAQYDDNVEFRYHVKHKRGEQLLHVHHGILVFRGNVTIPENLLWDIKDEGYVITKRFKFRSFDHRMEDTILNYMASIGNFPVINTHNVNWPGLNYSEPTDEE